MRITLPNIRLFFEAYEKKDMFFFSWIKDSEYYKYDSWLRLISRMVAEPAVDNIAEDFLYQKYDDSKHYREFCNFLISKQNEIKNDQKYGWKFFPDNHKNFFDEEIITNYLKKLSFKNIDISQHNKSKYKFFQNSMNFKKTFDFTRPHMSLYVEFTK